MGKHLTFVINRHEWGITCLCDSCFDCIMTLANETLEKMALSFFFNHMFYFFSLHVYFFSLHVYIIALCIDCVLTT
jgi:hypothetical protein